MALKDLLFGNDTLDSTSGVASDKNLTEKKVETTSGTQTRDATTRQEEAVRAAQQQNTKQTSTTNTTGTTNQNQVTTGKQNTAEKQTTLDVQTQNLLKGLLGNIAGQQAPGTGSFNAVSPVISQLLGLSNTAITEDAKAQQELARLDFQENVLPQLSLFSQEVGSTENSAAQLLKTKALADLTTKLTAISTDAGVKERQLRSNELLQLLSGGTQLGSAESQAGLANTQQAGIIASILKGAEVNQTSDVTSLQNLINNITQQQTTSQVSDTATTATSQSDSLQLQKILDKSVADQTTGSIAQIIEAINQTQSGTQQQDNGILDSISKLLAATSGNG